MNDAKTKLMTLYGITEEKKSVFTYKDYKYRRLEDALNNAKLGAVANGSGRTQVMTRIRAIMARQIRPCRKSFWRTTTLAGLLVDFRSNLAGTILSPPLSLNLKDRLWN